MKISDNRFCDASQYTFEKIFPGLVFPVQEILAREAALDLGARERRFLLYAASILIFTGLKIITKFHSFGTDVRDDVEGFVGLYFPETYRWQYKKLYRAYEQGFLHEGNQAVVFKDKAGAAAFEQTSENILHVNVPVFFADFQAAVNKFREALNRDEGSACRDSFFRNYEKILTACAPQKTIFSVSNA